MRIKNILIVLGFILVSVAVVLLINIGDSKFYLENKYYDNPTMQDIDTSTLNKLISISESFVLFVYQPACVNSANFEVVLNNFQTDTQISIKKITFSNLKGTELEDVIKYYPSFVIFKDGKVVDYLDANDDEDTEIYKTKEGFYKWFTTYVKLKDVAFRDTVTTTTTPINRDIVINIEGAKKEEGKVNIYLFWGDGCPHCKHEKDYLASLEKEYGNLFTVYKFEVWDNPENANLMRIFSEEMGDGTKGGVPYTVVGSTSFRGFGDSTEEKLKQAIIEESKGNFDIYFDVLKDKYNKK